jgi:hypothetical protein
MKTPQDYKVDRTGWPSGPWDSEPDRAQWEHAGFACLAVRNHYGAWCGYVGVPPGHSLHSVHYDNCDEKLEVHGGLTYSAGCKGVICHVPKLGEPENLWWLGFDTAHLGDMAPGSLARWKSLGIRSEYPEDEYRTLDYVTAETNRLAEQIARAQ